MACVPKEIIIVATMESAERRERRTDCVRTASQLFEEIEEELEISSSGRRGEASGDSSCNALLTL